MCSFQPAMVVFGRCLSALAAVCLLSGQGLAAEAADAAPVAEPAAPAAPAATAPAAPPAAPATAAAATSNKVSMATVPEAAATRKTDPATSKSAPGSTPGTSSSKTSRGDAPKTGTTGTSNTAGKVTAPLDLNWFSYIPQRNIFNPNRRGPVSLTQAAPAPRVDSFSLVGVMSYDKGQFAFFDGTSTQYKQALKIGGKIDAYTVTEITNNKVKLKAGEKELDFVMGMQMRREGTGEWKMSQRLESFASTSSGSASSGGSSTPTDAAPGSALERLLKKRAEEAAKQ